MNEKREALVLSQGEIAKDIYDLWIKQPEIAGAARPGQFVMIYCEDNSRLLPRPISICEVNAEKGHLRLVYRIAGEGTAEFSKLVSADRVKVMGPLGNGFPLSTKKAILVGGGIGIPPMLELARRLKGEKQIVLGYRDERFLDKDLERFGRVWIATEDGSAGTKGTVIDAIKEHKLEAEVIYACGPTPMLKALQKYAIVHNIECYLSLEERMACGIGACLACVCKSVGRDEHTNVHNKRVCKDGPVFEAREVEL
ncbi:dihydroorotate dehydrogenase electron transfer subunit [Diplocloster agilis]|uniref:dihydroorotate dehydrogenase electron transfer subunit n=1 Tax=Diplocloster agilis TaxID=2850323 RepID=UPI0008218AB5|nr:MULTISPECIES: dihydroorotate dehydrogenase electron transfer subunit [Lachnospiraceae]MBU9746704.1 dihydroorotate dehydrogenase electron transfer subunit [Diplocloster agilis]MCU6736488.1 dihydroorotate dehydrogenase electron transfer subunit [Suonthocola fibrivorans]SCJ91001.1 Dihydrdoorotate oxidase B%2C electron transfer subunit [uncultured Clostridium sp.]